MEKNKELSFFNRVIISLKDFEKYKYFIEEKVRNSIKYIFQLLLIFTLIVSIAFSIKYITSLNNLFNFIRNDLPEFNYENGILHFDNELEYKNEDEKQLNGLYYKILINTSDLTEDELNKKIEEIKGYDFGIVLLKDRFQLSNKIADGMVEGYTYKELQDNLGIQESFNKNDLINYIDSKFNSTMIKLFIIIFAYLFLSYFISILIDSLILAVLCFITSKIVKVNVKFGQSYSIALHALTLPIILNVIYIIINLFTGFYIKYFDMMYTAISYIYAVAVILSIKQNIIKETAVIGQIREQENKDNNENKQDTNENKDTGKEEKNKKENESEKNKNVGEEKTDKTDKKDKKDKGQDNNIGKPANNEIIS